MIMVPLQFIYFSKKNLEIDHKSLNRHCIYIGRMVDRHYIFTTLEGIRNYNDDKISYNIKNHEINYIVAST